MSENTDVSLEVVRLSDIAIPTPEEMERTEGTFRRGFAHAVNTVCDLSEEYGHRLTTSQLAKLANLSMDIRYDGEAHPDYTADFMRRARRILDCGWRQKQ